MLVVGLTGGIATGKSTVSSLLKSHNIPVIDADVIAREVVQPGTRALSQIIAYFGKDIVQSDGTLDRPKLGVLIFNDEKKRKKLNSIIHPAVRRAMYWAILKCWLRGQKYCILDVPLLIETGLHKLVGKVVVVDCSEEVQLKRLMARDESTEEAALSRIRSQIPISEKMNHADAVIDNSKGLEDLEAQVTDLLHRLDAEVRWTWMAEWLVPPLGIILALSTLTARTIKRNLGSSVPNRKTR